MGRGGDGADDFGALADGRFARALIARLHGIPYHENGDRIGRRGFDGLLLQPAFAHDVGVGDVGFDRSRQSLGREAETADHIRSLGSPSAFTQRSAI